MAVSDYKTDPNENTTISGINIAEGCQPSGINNAIRQLMADVKADKTAQDTATAAAQSAAESAQDSADKCLQLTGGTMTGDVYDKNNSLAFLPAGAVFAFAANSDPAGCLLCNGAAVSRTTYAKLFEAIWTLYGEGDGSTTFNLPNLTDKFIQGSGTAGTVKSAGLPNITGKAYVPDNGVIQWFLFGNREGAIDAELRPVNNYLNLISGDFQNTVAGLNIDASRSSSVYGSSSTVQPPALTMRYYIKY